MGTVAAHGSDWWRMKPAYVALWAGLACSAPCAGAEIAHEVSDDGSAIIFIYGDIAAGDDAKFRELSVRYPNALVGLSSDGGALLPAIEIGNQIRLRGYGTVVIGEATCTSACALIWIAGSPRYLQPGARLGFHASYRDEGGKLVETGLGNAIVGHYLSQLNLSQRAVIFATKASPYQISWLDQTNKAASGIEFTEVARDTEAISEPTPIPPPVRTSRVTSRDAVPAEQADSRAILRTLRREIAKPAFADDMAQKFDVSASQKRIIGDHVRALYANEAFLVRLASEVEAAGSALTGPNAGAIGTEIGAALTEKLLYKGLLRLSDADLQIFFDHLALLSIDATHAECAAIYWPTDRASPTLEFEVAARQGDDNLRSYLALIRKAIHAELAGVPGVVKLTATQSEAAENAMTKSLGDLTKDFTAAQSERLADTLLAMDKASTADKCDATALMMSAASRMEGVTGDWYRRHFIASIDE